MYCPKCSNEAIHDEIKFCSKCGFSLSGVKKLISEEIATPTADKKEEKKVLTRRAGLVRGAKSLLTGAVLSGIGYLLVLIQLLFLGMPKNSAPYLERDLFKALAYGSLAIMFFAATFGLFGIARMIYAIIFEKGSLFKKQDVSSGDNHKNELKTESRKALPSAQSIPVSMWGHKVNTAEMMPIPSVTENTTRLL